MTLRPATEHDWEPIRGLLERHGLPVAGAREHLAMFLLPMVEADSRVSAGSRCIAMWGSSAPWPWRREGWDSAAGSSTR